MNPDTLRPIRHHLNNAKEIVKNLPKTKHWYCGGLRSVAVAAEILRAGEIIALPTDTIYGLAGLAQNQNSVSKLYKIKQRDLNKPLAICLWNVEQIENWAYVQDLPVGLPQALLPGPTTLVLKRKEILNPNLNPGLVNVGIRIPKSLFIRNVVKFINEPLALTSANRSNEQSSLNPSEFEELWPELNGIFYERVESRNYHPLARMGSTVVDLSIKGQYSVIRKGKGCKSTINILKKFGLCENTQTS